MPGEPVGMCKINHNNLPKEDKEWTPAGCYLLTLAGNVGTQQAALSANGQVEPPRPVVWLDTLVWLFGEPTDPPANLEIEKR